MDCGADQIAQGAQTQAQGATEQASSVEALSDKLRQLHLEAEQNVDNAAVVSENTRKMGAEMQKSNQEMTSLLGAIDNISQQSNEIVKIIKAIEDIAFQTNILALNAAVEVPGPVRRARALPWWPTRCGTWPLSPPRPPRTPPP